MDPHIDTYHAESLFRKVLDNRITNRGQFITPKHFSYTRTRLNSGIPAGLNSSKPMSPKHLCKKSNGQNEGFFVQHMVENDCSNHCKNLKILRECDLKIKELLEENEKLAKINEHLMLIINKKDEMYMQVSCENYNMKCTLKNLKNLKGKSQFKGITTKSSLVLKSIDPGALGLVGSPSVHNRNSSALNFGEVSNIERVSVNNLEKAASRKMSTNNSIRLSKFSNMSLRLSEKIPSITNEVIKISSKQLIKSKNIKEIPQPYSTPKTHLSKSPVKETAGGHYERIYEMTARNQQRKYKGEQRVSFLSMNELSLKKLIKNDMMKELYNLTLSDEEFITSIRVASDDRLISYCDVVGNMIKDYQNSIKLIQRIKHFLQASVSLVNTVLQEDSTACLIKNACEILDCERTTIFVHDKSSDKLIVHSGKGLKKSELKVPKDRGIVGMCFLTGERIKVEEAYSDVRFNKEVDMVTGFRTKNILCLPLKDNDGVIFGAIQSINKKNASFNTDDEELMDIFSRQASAILKNSMNFDENSQYISRLKLSIYFSFKIEDVQDLFTFTLLAEDHLMSLFSVNSAQFLIYKQQSDCLYHVTKYHVEEKKKVGITNYVRHKKQFYGCQSIDDSEYYNNLSDLETGYSLITSPIMHLKNDSELLAVVQLAYGGKLVTGMRKPKELEMSILELFLHMSASWIANHHDDPFFSS